MADSAEQTSGDASGPAWDECSRSRALAAELAARSLQAMGGASRGGEVSMGLPAARLVLADDASQYGGLVEGFRGLSAVGRAHVTAVTDPALAAGSSPARGIGEVPALRDGAGHARPAYHALVLHLHLAAFAGRYETLPAAMWSGCEAALPEAIAPARAIESFTDKPPPHDAVDLALWYALCLLEESRLTSRDVDREIVDAVVHEALREEGDDGSLHPIEPGESLDAWTYRELIGLHALADLALLSGNPDWLGRAQAVARYHLRNTQPDNVTTEPWGLPAFLLSRRTCSFADQQLHDATTGGLSAVTTLLLADTVRE